MYNRAEKYLLLAWQNMAKNKNTKEIGKILGCSEGTVKSRIFYTTRKLAKKLQAFNPYKAEVPKDEKIK